MTRAVHQITMIMRRPRPNMQRTMPVVLISSVH